MNILALDLGTSTGWALLEGSTGRVESGVQIFDVKRGESPGMRYVAFRRWLATIGQGVGLIVYEMPHLRGGAAAEVLSGFSTRVHEYCAETGAQHTSVHSATLKKFATGSGKASKLAMIDAAQVLFGESILDDNQADALLLLRYANREIEVPVEAAK